MTQIGGARIQARARLRVPEAWLCLIALIAALIVAFEFAKPIAWREPTLRAATETTMTMLALAGAALVRDQFSRTRSLRTLLLLVALLTLAIIEFVASTLPAALLARPASNFTAALPLGQLVVAGMFVAAALAPRETMVECGRRPVVTVAVSCVAASGLAALGLLFRAELLAGANGPGRGLDRAVLHPLGFVVLLAAAGLFAFAGIRLARSARLESNQVLALLAGAAILFAAARLYYLAMPSVSPEQVTLREVLRLTAFGLIFAAALRASFELRRTMAEAAAISERRRVAQDLHDGIAQDLALIAAHSAHMSKEFGAEHPVVLAARHALALSRGTISELSYSGSGSAREALDAVAHELRHRFGIQIAVAVEGDGDLSPEDRKHLARIAREAIANAVRHGAARCVTLVFRRTGAGFSLRVRDDGDGMVATSGASSPEGFGMSSMRQRASAMGGSLSVCSPCEGGTELEVSFPA